MASVFGLGIPSAWQVRDPMVYQIIDFFVFGVVFTFGAAAFSGASLLDDENVFWEGYKEVKLANGTVTQAATKLTLHALVDDKNALLHGADVKDDADMVYNFVLASSILLLIASVARWVYHSRMLNLNAQRSTQLRLLELFHLIAATALLSASLHVFSDLRHRSLKAAGDATTHDTFYDMQTYGPGWWFVVTALTATTLNFLWSFALVTNITEGPGGNWREEGVNIGMGH